MSFNILIRPPAFRFERNEATNVLYICVNFPEKQAPPEGAHPWKEDVSCASWFLHCKIRGIQNLCLDKAVFACAEALRDYLFLFRNAQKQKLAGAATQENWQVCFLCDNITLKKHISQLIMLAIFLANFENKDKVIFSFEAFRGFFSSLQDTDKFLKKAGGRTELFHWMMPQLKMLKLNLLDEEVYEYCNGIWFLVSSVPPIDLQDVWGLNAATCKDLKDLVDKINDWRATKRQPVLWFPRTEDCSESAAGQAGLVKLIQFLIGPRQDKLLCSAISEFVSNQKPTNSMVWLTGDRPGLELFLISRLTELGLLIDATNPDKGAPGISSGNKVRSLGCETRAKQEEPSTPLQVTFVPRISIYEIPPREEISNFSRLNSRGTEMCAIS